MKKLLAIMLAISALLGCVSFVAAEELKTFTDVAENAWYYTDVANAVELGIINGKTATTFAPNDNLTYAEAIKIAACMYQLDSEGAVSFATGITPWYKVYADYCEVNGIISKEYDYNTPATREGYMEIFANALPDKALEPINYVPDDSIPDVPSSDPYAPAIYKLYRAGILAGVDAEHNCNPSSTIKRCEVAAIITRMMDKNARVKFSMGVDSVEDLLRVWEELRRVDRQHLLRGRRADRHVRPLPAVDPPLHILAFAVVLVADFPRHCEVGAGSLNGQPRGLASRVCHLCSPRL